MNVNKVFLMGRLTADPELKTSQNNVSVLRFTVAVNRRFVKQGQDNNSDQQRATVDFIDCVAFRQQAEFVGKYFKKGSAIIVFGSIQIDNYKDKNGNNARSFRIVVDEVSFGESKAGGGQNSPRDNFEIAQNKEPDAYTNAVDSDFFSEIKDMDDELPF